MSCMISCPLTPPNPGCMPCTLGKSPQPMSQSGCSLLRTHSESLRNMRKIMLTVCIRHGITGACLACQLGRVKVLRASAYTRFCSVNTDISGVDRRWLRQHPRKNNRYSHQEQQEVLHRHLCALVLFEFQIKISVFFEFLQINAKTMKLVFFFKRLGE